MTQPIPLEPMREDSAARGARRARRRHAAAVAAGILWGLILLGAAAGFAAAMSP